MQGQKKAPAVRVDKPTGLGLHLNGEDGARQKIGGKIGQTLNAGARPKEEPQPKSGQLVKALRRVIMTRAALSRQPASFLPECWRCLAAWFSQQKESPDRSRGIGPSYLQPSPYALVIAFQTSENRPIEAWESSWAFCRRLLSW